MKNSFVLYGSWRPMVKAMTDEQAGQLLKACYAFDAGDEYEITDPAVKIIFETVKATMQADRDKYDDVSEKRRQSANSGKRMQMQANASKSMQKDANAGKSAVCSDLHYDSESDSDSDKDIKEKYKREKFRKPTVEEIRIYCEERKNGLDAQRIFDHYEANGWMRGKSHVRDWKACVRTWEKGETKTPPRPKSYQNQRVYDYDALEKRLIAAGGAS